MTNGAKSGQNKPREPQHRGTWVAEGRLYSTGSMSTVCKKHASPMYPVRGSSWVTLGCLVTTESADDAALLQKGSVTPFRPGMLR